MPPVRQYCFQTLNLVAVLKEQFDVLFITQQIRC